MNYGIVLAINKGVSVPLTEEEEEEELSQRIPIQPVGRTVNVETHAKCCARCLILRTYFPDDTALWQNLHIWGTGQQDGACGGLEDSFFHSFIALATAKMSL